MYPGKIGESDHKTNDNREEKWIKEVNVVAWNGGKPKADVKDWNASHDRMSSGTTITEDQVVRLMTSDIANDSLSLNLVSVSSRSILHNSSIRRSLYITLFL